MREQIAALFQLVMIDPRRDAQGNVVFTSDEWIRITAMMQVVRNTASVSDIEYLQQIGNELDLINAGDLPIERETSQARLNRIIQRSTALLNGLTR